MKAINRTIIGLLIVAVGASLLLSNLNLLPFDVRIGDWWPVFIIVAGVIMLLNDLRSYLWSILLIFFGVVLQLNQFDVIDVNPWQLLWPVVIIVVGLSVIINRSSLPQKNVSKKDREDITAILSGGETHVESKDFKASKVTAVCGGAMLDLSKATIKKEASIDLFAFWGGIEIIVPENVVVKSKTAAILGGIENKARSDKSDAKNSPVLYIGGDVIMSGVEIKRASK